MLAHPAVFDILSTTRVPAAGPSSAAERKMQRLIKAERLAKGQSRVFCRGRKRDVSQIQSEEAPRNQGVSFTPELMGNAVVPAGRWV